VFLAARGVTAHPVSSPAAALIRARSAAGQIAGRIHSRDTLPASPAFNLTLPWLPLGPAHTTTAAYGPVTGRIASIAVDPADSSGNTVYLGTTGGGVWKSINAAGPAAQVSFAPITDLAPSSSSGLGSLSIGAVSVEPGGTGVLLAGTGDPNDALDSYYGQGILRSIDHGVTWQGIDESHDLGEPHSFIGEGFAGFAWSTATPGLVVAAVTQALDGIVVNALQANSFQGLYYAVDIGTATLPVWQLATINDGPRAQVQGPNESAYVTYTGENYTGNGATAVVWNKFRQMFYAALQYHGYYSSPDGVTWTRLVNQPGAGLSLTNCPTSSYDEGSVLGCPMVRGALAVQPVTGDMFAFTVGPANTIEGGNPDQGIWEDVCNSPGGTTCAPGATDSFSTQLPSVPLENGSGAIVDGDYSLWLAAVPAGGGSTDTLLYAGTEDIFKYSVTGTRTWQNLTNNVSGCATDSIAPWQHAVAVASGVTGPLMFFGNDSGIWRSTDGIQPSSLPSPCSSDLQNLNNGLGSLAEVSSIAEDPGRSGTLMAAQGGIGTSATSSAAAGSPVAWQQVLDGEGSYVAIDPEVPSNWYASGYGVSIYVCGDGGACDANLFPGAAVVGDPQTDSDGETLLNPAAWVLDPQDSTKMIVGTCRVWRGSVAGGVADWSSANALSPVLNESSSTSCNGEAQISALGASGAISVNGVPTSQEILYAGMYSTDRDGISLGGGTVAGHVFTQTLSAAASGPTAWTDISQYPSIVVNGIANYQTFNPGGFTVSSVVADTHDSSGQTVYATIQGFSGNGVSEPVIYRSTNQGQSWYNITSNLAPVVPVNALVVDPGDADIVYVATDMGVFVATDVASCASPGASCWSRFGISLPDSPVTTIAAWGSGTAGLLRAGTYGRGIWQTGLVSALPLTTILVQPNPATLVFPNQQEQTASLPQSVTITNTGNAALTVTGFQFSQDAEGNTDFSETDNCSAAVPVSQSCVVVVQFDPTTTGPLSAVLTMLANLQGGQAQISLSGTGTPSNVRLNPADGLIFGPTAISTTSAAENIVVENLGTGPVSLGSPSVSGLYRIAGNTCGSSVSAQHSCTVGIVFAPTTNGVARGTFSIPAGAITLTASLSGTGLSPATDTLSGASNGQLQFAPQLVGTVSPSQTVLITNAGGVSLTGVSATSSSGDFVVKTGCYVVVGQSSCALLVGFAPTVAGTRTGTLTIADVLHSGTSAQTIAMVGTGVARAGVASVGPQSLDFNIQGVSSTSTPQSVTLTNNSAAPLTGLLFSATGNFAVTPGTCGASLAVGDSCLPSVTFTPPSTPGPQTGVLTVTGSNQQFSTLLSGEGVDYSLAVVGGSTKTLVNGSTTTYQVQIQPIGNSYGGPLTIACSVAPANYSCSTGGGTVSLLAGQPAQVTVTAQPVTAASVPNGAGAKGRMRPWGFSVMTLALIFPLWRGRRKGRAGFPAVFCLVCLLGTLTGSLTGCAFTTKSTGGSTGGTGTGTGVTTSATNTITLTVSVPGLAVPVPMYMVVEQ
jgi:hypothetical protein